MKSSRAAAMVSLAYAGAFGIPTAPIAVYLRQNGRLPSFFGLFDMMAGPWSARQSPESFTMRLGAFFAVTSLVALSGWLMLRERRGGRAMNLALMPIEAAFWIGFALPIPWMIAVARASLVIYSWVRHEPPEHPDPPA